MWSSAAQLPTPAYPFEDRRTSKYTRSSHHSSSSSSAGFSTTAFSQPSPSSSASSTSSSLRTPPDLLLNGATLATSLTSPAKGLLGKARVSAAAPATTIRMTVEQLESRLNTLARVSKAPAVSDALPSPPSSPRTRSHDASSSQRTSQKRKADGRTTGSPEARRPRWTSDDNSGVPVDSLSLPRVREWTKEQFFETAVAYRHQGRALKHRGDRRLRESSAQFTSPISEELIASLEQTDALLLYTYGFWCEDQGGGTCISANWTSLYGLLKYVYLRHEKSKMYVLSGLCRLLEATVLRHVAAHDMRMLNHRLGKASSTSSPSQAEVLELSTLMTKVVGDQERSARLAAQARQTALNLAYLRQTYPRLARFCESSMHSAQWMSTDQASLAHRLDPSYASSDLHNESAYSTNGWSWPLDTASPFPMLVCFGRAALREAAREAQVAFDTEPVSQT